MINAKQLPSGSWRCRVCSGKKNGKRSFRSFTASTKKEAEYLAAKYAATKQEETCLDVTVKKAIEEYIENKENVLSPSTVRGYQTVCKTFSPGFISMKVKKLTQFSIQGEINQLASRCSPKTCRNCHGLLSAVLKIYRPEMILRTTLPQKKKRDIYVPDEDEVKKIKPLAEKSTVYIPFLLATQCGLRASEISGLELKDVHKDYIEITQARVKGIENNNDGVLKQPKSNAGYRKIPIDKTLHDILIENAEGDRIYPFSSSVITTAWGRFRKRNKLNSSLNFHALRHHFASKCLLLGIPQKYIAELMGHSDTTMIEKVYQHTFPSAMLGYADQLRKHNSELLKSSECDMNGDTNANKPHNEAKKQVKK